MGKLTRIFQKHKKPFFLNKGFKKSSEKYFFLVKCLPKRPDGLSWHFAVSQKTIIIFTHRVIYLSLTTVAYLPPVNTL